MALVPAKGSRLAYHGWNDPQQTPILPCAGITVTLTLNLQNKFTRSSRR